MYKFTSEELKVIEKEFKAGRFLGDNEPYDSIVEMKRDLELLLTEIDITDVFPELYERNDYRVEKWDYTDCSDKHVPEDVLYRDLNKGSAKVIRRYVERKHWEWLVETQDEYLDWDFIISWWSEDGYHYYQCY